MKNLFQIRIYKAIKNLQIVFFCLILAIIGTGFYTQFPGKSYVLILVACILILLDPRFFWKPLDYVNPKILLGYALFNIFLLIQVLLYRLEENYYLSQFYATSLILLINALINLNLDRRQYLDIGIFRQYGIFIFLSLFVLLMGQFAQVFGLIEGFDFIDGNQEDFINRGRPGGFLNSNVTAAIAIVMLFSLLRLGKLIGYKYLFIGLPVTLVIVILSQSRVA